MDMNYRVLKTRQIQDHLIKPPSLQVWKLRLMGIKCILRVAEGQVFQPDSGP